MAEPIIELGAITEVDEANNESTFRNTNDSVEITLGTFIDIVGAGFGDGSNRVPESFFEALDVDTTVDATTGNITTANTTTTNATTVDTTNIKFANTVESPQTVDPATNTVTVDVSTSNWYDPIAVTENITIDVTNVDSGGNQLTLYLTDGDGMGPYTITWPASFEWVDGVVQDTIDQNGSLEITAISPDGGTTWRARRSGRNFE